MTYYTKGLLTMLISLFILSACKNPTGVGLEVDPEDEIEGAMRSLPVHAVIQKDDSSRSVNFGQTVFGFFNDPVFGTTTADLAMEIGVPSSYPKIGIGAEIDSAILVLPYGLDYYGDTTGNSSIRLIVRQLDEPYQYGTYTNKQWSVKEEVLGSITLPKYAYRDSISIVRHIDGKDTLVKDLPQLRIPLSGDFFKTLFSVDSTSIASLTSYRNHTKGLYLSVDTAHSGAIGGLVTLRAISLKSGIELVYKQHNGESGSDGKIETYRRYFPIYQESQQNAVFGLGLASTIRYQYKPEIQDQLNNPEQNSDRLYLQGAAGLRSKIYFPGLDSLKSEQLAVNKAELVMYVDTEALGTQYSVSSPRLTLYREDIAGQRRHVPDGDTRQASTGGPIEARSLGNLGFGGYFDSVRKRYVFQLTSFVQDVLLDKIKSAEVFVAPGHPLDQFIQVNPILSTGSRTVIKGSDRPDQPMKLNIYYTKVK